MEQTDYFMYNQDFESADTHIWMNTEKLNEAIENNAAIDSTVLISRDQQVREKIKKGMHGHLFKFFQLYYYYRWTLQSFVS